MAKVTVSVPVYNVKKYLQQCVDSLIAQTLQDIEIILVDDGSTDGSGEMCDEYAKCDSRIKVIHKPNGGLASARQVGMENARGEYYIMCDGDDWTEPTMYEEMYNKAKAEDADLVMCDFYSNYPDGRQVVANSVPQDCSTENVTKGVLMRRFSGSVCSKLVRRSVYERYGLYWEKGINLGEDVFMFLKLLQHPIKIAALPKPLYHYRRIMYGASLTNTLTMKSFKQAERIHEWKKANIDDKLYGRELFHSALDYAFIGVRAKDVPVDYYNQWVKENIPYRNFFRYRVLTFKSCLIFSSRLVGLGFARRLCDLLYRYWYK